MPAFSRKGKAIFIRLTADSLCQTSKNENDARLSIYLCQLLGTQLKRRDKNKKKKSYELLSKFSVRLCKLN